MYLWQVRGWGFQFLLGTLDELQTHTVYFSFCSWHRCCTFQWYYSLCSHIFSPVVAPGDLWLFPICKPSPPLKEKLAVSLTGYMFSHSSSGSQNILAAEPFLFLLESFREVQFVRQIKAEFLCLKHEWEAGPLSTRRSCPSCSLLWPRGYQQGSVRFQGTQFENRSPVVGGAVPGSSAPSHWPSAGKFCL